MSISGPQLGSQRLTGRVAFISGGLRGIGLACAERFLAEGAEVVLSDLDAADSDHAKEVMGKLGQAASYVQANVTQEADWQRARDVVQERHGKLHILVNNAGTDLTGAVETLSMESWRRIMDINVDGVFLGVKTFVPMMAQSGKSVPGGASIINVSSIMGMVGYNEVSAYNASKGAVRLFTKGIAVEFAQKKMPIRANSLHPGFVVTPLLHAGFQRWVASGFAEKSQDLMDAVAAQTPMGRLAEPFELASGAFFLASADSAYMTGAELVMDGGWTAQ
jgi:NAD(P)-dependent dehydrogenase (short-subunit alcohol dehydrogenase family)